MSQLVNNNRSLSSYHRPFAKNSNERSQSDDSLYEEVKANDVKISIDPDEKSHESVNLVAIRESLQQ
jgi:hypothetical protein